MLDPDGRPGALRRELDLVSSAIWLVAGGGAPGVTLVGLALGSAVLAGSAQAARTAGVVLEPIWQSDLAGCDIRVCRRTPTSRFG
jgi:hypothetical protein